ncbi:MAG: TerB family tellurite resistance protein [Kofleriaceae bacterium]|nr:TerB family tellurite resistance protein [Myxococcales bacterium]MCB9565030.1 TerB family tellurite resistance protein [Kofleriaceae bacterium]
MSFLRKMFSGRVKTDDPRRYVIETMLGAMEADGEVLDAEMETLQGNLESHDLFSGLSGEEVQRFIDLAADAIREAGGGRNRVPEIAKGLPSRSQRLTAYAMACEVCVADRDLAEAEIDFLDNLQHAFGLDEVEAKELFEAARKHSGLLTLEEKTAKMRALMPRFVDCMALMAAADGEVHHQERLGIRAVLRNIPDMSVLTADELDEAIEVAFERVAGKDVKTELDAIAKVIALAADRYWTVVYMMIIALADGKGDWREVAFLEATKQTFELSDYQMDVAMDTARQFPSVELGGEVPE